MFQSDDFDDFITGESFLNIEKALSQQESTMIHKTLTSNDENEKKPTDELNQSPSNKNIENVTLNKSNNFRNQSDNLETPNRTKRKRKFPGPAGLLPENFPENSNDRLGHIPLSQSFPNSQNLMSSTVFDEAPWLSMWSEMKGIENHSIATIKQKALEHKLIGRRVPILAGVVQSIDKTTPDPLLVLRDKSGEIQCTLHHKAWENLCCHLVAQFSVLVLKNSVIFSTGTTLKKIYLNISNNNILSVYCDEDSVQSVNSNVLKSSRTDLSKIYSEEIISLGDSRVTVLKNRHLDKEDILQLDNKNSTSSLMLQDDSSNFSNDIIAQTLLDGITDEFTSQEFQ